MRVSPTPFRWQRFQKALILWWNRKIPCSAWSKNSVDFRFRGWCRSVTETKFLQIVAIKLENVDSICPRCDLGIVRGSQIVVSRIHSLGRGSRQRLLLHPRRATGPLCDRWLSGKLNFFSYLIYKLGKWRRPWFQVVDSPATTGNLDISVQIIDAKRNQVYSGERQNEDNFRFVTPTKGDIEVCLDNR